MATLLAFDSRSTSIAFAAIGRAVDPPRKHGIVSKRNSCIHTEDTMSNAELPQPLQELVDAYRLHQEDSQFEDRSRDEAMFESKVQGSNMKFHQLQTCVELHQLDREVTMAIAVALKFRLEGEDEADAAITITKLLRSPFSRTRYRAVESAAYRAGDGASEKVRAILRSGVKSALVGEECESVLMALCEATRALHSSERMSALNDMEQRIWDRLKGRIMRTRGLCVALGLSTDETDQAAVRKHIERMRDKGFSIETMGRSGYWRKDAPPR